MPTTLKAHLLATGERLWRDLIFAFYFYNFSVYIYSRELAKLDKYPMIYYYGDCCFDFMRAFTSAWRSVAHRRILSKFRHVWTTWKPGLVRLALSAHCSGSGVRSPWHWIYRRIWSMQWSNRQSIGFPRKHGESYVNTDQHVAVDDLGSWMDSN